MSDMKCPFCGRKLEQYWYEDFECWYCPDVACKGYVMTATKDMWQELIRTRKALEIIKKEFHKETMPDFAVIRDALKTALEQKDK